MKIKTLLASAVLILSTACASAQLVGPPVNYGSSAGTAGIPGDCTGSFCTASAPLAVNLGGTGLNNSGATGLLYFASGTPAIATTTGTGNVVLSASPTLTGTVTASALTLSSTLTTNLTGGGIQCVHVSNTGVVSGTGSDCGSGGGSVTSVFGRSGVVVSATNDYNFNQLAGTLVLTTQVTGTLPVANGGTGITSLGTGVATALGTAVSGSGAICLASGSSCASSVSVTSASANVVVNPTPGTGTFTVGAAFLINAQTGTSYALLAGDGGKLVTFSNGSATAVTIAQAGTTGFGAGYATTVQNKGAGTVTITPATSTINGSANITVATNRGCSVVSDGTNYQVSDCTALLP